jgi:putative addiction module component (TIGR02574 family)
MTGHVALPIPPKRGTFTGMSAIKELEQAVLALPTEQRVHLAESLLESLSPATTVWSEAEELAEVERRERELERGKVQPISDTEFWERIDARRKR